MDSLTGYEPGFANTLSFILASAIYVIQEKNRAIYLWFLEDIFHDFMRARQDHNVQRANNELPLILICCPHHDLGPPGYNYGHTFLGAQIGVKSLFGTGNWRLSKLKKGKLVNFLFFVLTTFLSHHKVWHNIAKASMLVRVAHLDRVRFYWNFQFESESRDKS